jgi:acylphosphatase
LIAAMSDWVARRCLVDGRVQGVFFRASTRSRADALGVSGHAHNLPDGRVEVLACGPPDAVEALCNWLWQGPPAAEVTAVAVEVVALESLGKRPSGFSTG